MKEVIILPTPNIHLKEVLAHFKISNIQLAKAIHVDPSLVCRWLSGKRMLKSSSVHLDDLVEYILSLLDNVDDVEWLNQQFLYVSLPNAYSSVYQTKQNLISYLASDATSLKQDASIVRKSSRTQTGTGIVCINHLDIAIELEKHLLNLAKNSTIYIFIANDTMNWITSSNISRLLCHQIEKNDLRIKMTICPSGDAHAVSSILASYIYPLISGQMELFLVRGITQTVTLQTMLIVPEIFCALIHETPGSNFQPVASFIPPSDFLRNLERSFLYMQRCAQSLLTICHDDMANHIAELLYIEFAMPGDLNVVRDIIHPIFMTEDEFKDVLVEIGYGGAQLSWRIGEFSRFQNGFIQTFQDNSDYCEILTSHCLNNIIQHGCYKMPALYFMCKGFVTLGTKGCICILEGYLRSLRTLDHFKLYIGDKIPILNASSSWHLKRDQSISISSWYNDQPVLIHSNHMHLIREFQQRFNNILQDSDSVITEKSEVIKVLENTIHALKKREPVHSTYKPLDTD